MIDENKLLFVLRRACWIGRVKNSDLVNVFNITSATARTIMDKAIQKWPQVLYKHKKSGVYKYEEMITPSEANAETMISLFERKAKPEEIGLNKEESAIFFSEYPPKSRPLNDLDIILKYTFNNKQKFLEIGLNLCSQPIIIEILYVGLKKNDTPKWKKIVCNGLEYNGHTWRLIAQDINTEKYIQKHYVLSRIMQARPTPELTPKDFVFKDISKEEDIKLEVILNKKLTNEQRKVFENELAIKNGKISIPKKELFYFKRYYQDDRNNMDHIVWPLITYSKEIK